MKIYFTGLEDEEAQFFQKNLAQFSLWRYEAITEVPEDAEFLCVFIHDRVDRPFLEKHPKLRFIATRSTSVDHIDVAACTERGIPVAHVATYGENSVAEHTFALLLALARKLPLSVASVGKKEFAYSTLRGWELHGRTIGVVGTGRVGLHVIRIARGFGMKVIASDSDRHPFYAEVMDFEYVSFSELLERSDVITLHIPINETNHHLFDAERFKRCRRGVILINTARGGLVDTDALLAALDSGQVGGAGLDVIEEERIFRKHATSIISETISAHVHAGSSSAETHQRHAEWLKEMRELMKNKRLLSHPKVVFTPHVAFNTEQAIKRINEITLHTILSMVEGNLEENTIVNYELLAR